MRRLSPRCAVAAGCALLATLGGAGPAGAASAPELRGARFVKPAVVGRTATLELRAVDRERFVSGAVVAFAEEGVYGTSVCRPGADVPPPPEPEPGPGRGRADQKKTGPGLESTLSVPHRFKTKGPRAMLVKLDSAGCQGGGGVLLQPFTVTPVEHGKAPKPPELTGSPLTVLGTLEPPALPADPIEPDRGGGTDSRPPRPPHAIAAAGCEADLQPTPTNGARVRAATLCLINAERAPRGLRTLRMNRRMSRAARVHSRNMVDRAFFAHISPDGGDLARRLTAARWLPRRGTWSAGENIAFGEAPLSSPRATVDGWMQSTGHQENILDPTWRIAGVGVAFGVPGSRISGATYTMVFGT